MTAYLKQAPTGIPGAITRVDETNVEPGMLIAVSTVFAQAFGIPLAAVAGGFSQWVTGNVAADFYGILVREVPSIGGSLASDSDTEGGVPNPLFPQGIVVRGYINVKCTVGTPVRNGVVYIRTVASGMKNIGDFEATSDPGNNVALSNAQAIWATDGKDADNNAEIRVTR